MKEYLKEEFVKISANINELTKLIPVIETVGNLCIEAIKSGHKIIFCGNGGSAGDSQHLAAELVGRYKINRPAIAAVALTTNTSSLTAIGNDFGYETIFSRQIESLGRKGDVLIGISTSGNSENVIKAIKTAKTLGIKTVAMTGLSGGELKIISDYLINVTSDITNNIQEMHIIVGHLICDIIERALYGE